MRKLATKKIDVNNANVLVVSENGYGKRSGIEDYRVTNRGGKGVKTLNITEKTGNLIAIKNVTDNDDLMIINKSGIVIRLAVANLRVMGRATQGVRLINLKGNDTIAAVEKIEKTEDEEVVVGESGETIIQQADDFISDDEPSDEQKDGKDVDNNEED